MRKIVVEGFMKIQFVAKYQKIEGGTFWRHLKIFIKKSHKSKKSKGNPLVSFGFGNARKSSWLKLGLEPATAGFLLNRSVRYTCYYKQQLIKLIKSVSSCFSLQWVTFSISQIHFTQSTKLAFQFLQSGKIELWFNPYWEKIPWSAGMLLFSFPTWVIPDSARTKAPAKTQVRVVDRSIHQGGVHRVRSVQPPD